MTTVHREDRTYARGEGTARALATAWAEGWRAHRDAGNGAVNPYDGQPAVDEPPC